MYCAGLGASLVTGDLGDFRGSRVDGLSIPPASADGSGFRMTCTLFRKSNLSRTFWMDFKIYFSHKPLCLPNRVRVWEHFGDGDFGRIFEDLVWIHYTGSPHHRPMRTDFLVTMQSFSKI